MVKHEGPLVNRATLEIFELSAKKGWECGEKQLKLHRASGSGRWISIEKDVVRDWENKSLGGPTDEKKMLEPICSSLFRLSGSSFFSQGQNLCYLLVTFIWSPPVLDLSRYSLALSLFELSLPLFTFGALSPTNSPQPRTARNFLFRILDP